MASAYERQDCCSGIGEVAADILAKWGARIVLVARDKTRSDAILVRLRNCAPNVADSVYFADLTSLAEMKCVAAQIADQEHRIDVLINNAGALFARRRLTKMRKQSSISRPRRTWLRPRGNTSTSVSRLRRVAGTRRPICLVAVAA